MPFMDGIAGAVIGVGATAVMVWGILYAKKTFAKPNAAHEAEGREVFVGPEREAAKVLHTLADAGVAAWSEPVGDGSFRILVDQDQVEQVPQLLMVQQHLQQQGGGAAAAEPSSAGPSTPAGAG